MFVTFLTNGIRHSFLRGAYHPSSTTSLDAGVAYALLVGPEDGDVAIPGHDAHTAKVVHQHLEDVPHGRLCSQ